MLRVIQGEQVLEVYWVQLDPPVLRGLQVLPVLREPRGLPGPLGRQAAQGQ